jgi:hypothetical protein
MFFLYRVGVMEKFGKMIPLVGQKKEGRFLITALPKLLQTKPTKTLGNLFCLSKLYFRLKSRIINS